MKMQTQVPIGPTTVAGWGATLVGALATLLVVVFGTDSQTATTVSTAAFTIVAFAITQIGRYRQAHAQEVTRARAGAAPQPDDLAAMHQLLDEEDELPLDEEEHLAAQTGTPPDNPDLPGHP